MSDDDPCDEFNPRTYKSPGQYVLDQYAPKLEDASFPLWMNLGYWEQAATYAALMLLR